jgi:formate-dependent nitrite reductase membrane component NrfD
VAFVLAAVALVTGLLVVRQGPAAPGYRTARTGVALGIIAAVLGALNLAIDLEAFDYFSDPDPDPVAD